MSRALIIENEIVIPTAAGSANSFGSASVVRVVNVSGSAGTVGLTTIVGAATTAFITIPDGTVEYIQKKPGEFLYATGTLRGAKVGFTG